MIYGMLIGLMLSSFLIAAQNGPTERRLTEASTITRQLVKVVSLIIFISSTGAFIGLLIRGA